MIFGDRIELELVLRLDGVLHIGSGLDQVDDMLLDEEDRKDGKDPPEVALVQRDGNGNAVIPATSLKGALRSPAPLTSEQFDRLLGEQGDVPRDEHGDRKTVKGRIGRLWLGCATADLAPDEDRRFAGLTKVGCTRRQGFVKTAVRIDRKSGAAEENLLYNRETLGAGVGFHAKAILFLDDADETELRRLVAELLAPLARHPGLAIGGQQRQAGGRLRLDAISAVRHTINASLDLVRTPEPDLGRELLRSASELDRAAPETIRLTLTCPGPFISMRDKVKQADADGEEREITEPLTQTDGKPHLWPSSLLGALRARAAWLSELERLRSNGGEPPAGAADNRDRVVRRKKDAAALTPVERLFGVAGWRGLLRVASLQPTDGCPIAPQKMTSVTIDAFTGGGIDGRLFNERVFLGAAFVCDLELDERRQVTADDRALLDLLLKDIDGGGLELGHGSSKGFGWFDVAVERRPPAGAKP